MIDHARRDILAQEIGEDFIAELTTSFWADTWPLYETICACAKTGDTVDMRRALHTIAGSAGNLGLTGIAAAAGAAGTAIKTGGEPDIDHLGKALNETLADLRARSAA